MLREGLSVQAGGPLLFGKKGGEDENEQADLSTCSADLTQAQTDLGTCTDDLDACQAATGGTAFPATGQTRSFLARKTGDSTSDPVPVPDDGAVRAGAPMSFQDNGDGTITDLNTGLMWEKKCGLNCLDAGGLAMSLHEMGVVTYYAWSAIFADAVTVPA